MTANLKREVNLDDDEKPMSGSGEKIRKMSFTCKNCKVTLILSSEEDMRRHYIEAHGAKPVDCDVCHKLFPSQLQMEEHRQAKHSLACPVCSKLFGKSKDLDQHVKGSHGEKNKFKCQLCPDLAFDTENTYQQHMREVHEGSDSTRKCVVCQYVASGDEDLASHSGIHVSKKCNECGENFPSGGQYSKHRKQTGHDPWDNKNGKGRQEKWRRHK